MTRPPLARLILFAALLLIACGGEGASGITITTYEDQGNAHLTQAEVEAVLNGAPGPQYNSNPATSGPHAGGSVPCGVYREEIPDIFTVHSLEHGAVIVFYRRDLSQEEILALEGLARELSTHIIVMPRLDLTDPVIVAAWGRLGILEKPDLEAVRSFWRDYAQRGPERGVACPFEVDQGSGVSPPTTS